jgi:hypothetical protein
MEADMATVEVRNSITPSELAHLGEGSVAYVREMESEDLKGKFPGLPEIAPGTKLWALFAANGQPILLSDQRDRAVAGAFENDLVPVALH